MTASSMATMSFMSTAPRPQTTSSTTSPPNGSWAHADASTGTTSRWLRRTSGGSGLLTAGSAVSRAKQLPGPGSFRGRRPRSPRRSAPRRSSERQRFRRRSCPARGEGRVAGRVDRRDRMRARRWAIASSASAPGRTSLTTRRSVPVPEQCVAERAFSVRPGPPPVDEPRHADVGCEQEDRGQEQDGEAGRRGPSPAGRPGRTRASRSE